MRTNLSIMTGSKEETGKIFAGLGYSVPDSEVDDYASLLDKARTAFETVEAMDGSSLIGYPRALY